MLPLIAAFMLVQVPSHTGEREKVEVPLRAYFRYHQTGDPTGLSEAFHPEALLQWSEKSQRKILTQADWIRRATEQQAKLAGKPRPQVRCEIVALEITGDAAIAKVILDYPTFRFIDHMHLLKLESGWKIVDKIYHREEGAHPQP